MVRRTVEGFTLIEIMIVVGIIGMLASVFMPVVNKARDRAAIAAVQIELDTLKTVFQRLYDDTGRYPNGATSYCRDVSSVSDNEIDLSLDDAGLLANGLGWVGWEGPYVASIEDPWGLPYYLDEDYDCTAATVGCRGETVSGVSVIVSCGMDRDNSGSGGSCAYNNDNIVYLLCGS